MYRQSQKNIFYEFVNDIKKKTISVANIGETKRVGNLTKSMMLDLKCLDILINGKYNLIIIYTCVYDIINRICIFGL